MRKACNVNVLEKGGHDIRNHIVNTIINRGEGHGGSALSCSDILSVLYLAVMNIDPKKSNAINQDKFILSAGHKCLALYSALVVKGIINASVLDTYNALGSPIPGHPDATKLSVVEFSTGSLGHGLPVGCGFALASKMKGLSYRTYVLMGDGEQGEGTNWEAAAFAAHNQLDNLIGIIDENGLQINGTTKDVLRPSSLADRYLAFGWHVITVDGHDVKELYNAFETAQEIEGKPTMIIAKTIKGRGLSFAENNLNYHHWHPGKEEADKALEEMQQSGVRWKK